MARHIPQWLLLTISATLGGLVALGVREGVTSLRTPQSTPTPSAVVEAVVQPLPTPTSSPVVNAAPGSAEAMLALVRADLAQQGALLLVSRSERHIALASAALLTNDFGVADRELVAARTALDDAFGLVTEDLKQVIDVQRREVGRIRSELHIDPENSDEQLRATQDLLLGLIVPATP
jgi:hypothetical protein